MNKYNPQRAELVQIKISPDKKSYQNISRGDFEQLISKYCKEAAETNVPKLVQLYFVRDEDFAISGPNTIEKIEFPIIPEQYAFEKFVFSRYADLFKRRNALLEKSVKYVHLNEPDGGVTAHILHLPFNMTRNFLEINFDNVKKIVQEQQQLMPAIQHYYPELVGEFKNYFDVSLKYIDDIFKQSKGFVNLAAKDIPYQSTATDENQCKRIVNHVLYQLSQKHMWAGEMCEDEKVKMIEQYNLFDKSSIFAIDKDDSEFKATSEAMEVCYMMLEVFNHGIELRIGQSNQKPPSDGGGFGPQ